MRHKVKHPAIHRSGNCHSVQLQFGFCHCNSGVVGPRLGSLEHCGCCISRFSLIGEQLELSLKEIGDFFRNMNDEETSIGRLVKRRELYDSVLNASENLNRILEAIVNAEGAVGALIMDRQTADDATALLANLRKTTEQLQRTDGPLGVLLNDEEAARDLQGILDNADQLVSDARQGKGVLGRLMQDEAQPKQKKMEANQAK